MGQTNRRTLVQHSTTFNGIDFVEVADDAQTILRVHFLNAHVRPEGEAPGSMPDVRVAGGDAVATVGVTAAAWEGGTGSFSGPLILRLNVTPPADASTYTLAVLSDQLDREFATARLTFAARCPADVDCTPAAAACPEPPADAPSIDYLAKDFLSFRQALLDFSALRYPEWQERSEADFGVMFLEALCALADDLSYTQDRIAAEASLPTATQRRSVVRHARLVDYEPRPATAARVLLRFDVAPGVTEIPDGWLVSAPGPDGTPVPFETGVALADRFASPQEKPRPPKARAEWNAPGIEPYSFDGQCLPAGATGMYLRGDKLGLEAGQLLLIETAPAAPVDPPVRQVVRVLGTPVEDADRLFDPPIPVTHIQWSAADGLRAARDLGRTRVLGNLAVATQAEKKTATFAIPPAPAGTPAAVVRAGPNHRPDAPSPQYLFTLPLGPLAWVVRGDPPRPQPEIVLTSQRPGGGDGPWRFRRWLLDAEETDAAFTLDPAAYAEVAPGHWDFDGDGGHTVRFGDGVFGAVPEPGLIFQVTYRVGGGATGNVAADSVTRPGPGLSGVLAVTNPLPAEDGRDPEPDETVRRLAPQAFRAAQFRAVLPADYQAVAETLPWVQRAGTVFRWTGSWLTVFTTPDPRAGSRVTPEQRAGLIDLLNRSRLAGYESYVPDPLYVSLDVVVEVCARSDAFRGDVDGAVNAALGAAGGGFFAPDNFTFGEPLRLGDLEAAVQRANGVAGVTCVRYRIRGRTAGFAAMGEEVTVGPNEIIRCDDDPARPEHGSLRVIVRGGK